MRRARWKLVVPTATLTIVPFTLFAPSAEAFFPPLVPPPPVSVVSPPVSPPTPVVVPPVSPPPFVIVPPVVPPPVVLVPPTVPPSSTIPEPSSLAAGIAGLATAAGWAARRRRRAARNRAE